ncbi:MAG TPA: oligosaccharide flippase family protein [Candidatus Saccharimonadales bacterium]|nr:oligosaccharide flippase family protein [Candidatus Saccharimonadales bacterium]
MGYKNEAIKGISWIGLLSFATKTIGFFEAIILARILLPSQFGAYGVALLALGLLEVLTESGVNIILVQEKDIDSFIDSAWVVSILRGGLIMLIILFFASYIASFFHSSESLNLLYLISLVPLFRGFINPSVVKLQKDLKFGKDFWYKFTILCIDTAVSITVTFLTKNPIGIGIGLLSGVLVEIILSFVFISPKPRFKIENKYIRTIINRGKWITASSIFDYLFYNTDNIAVGRILGSQSLGIYQLGYSLAANPINEVGKVFVHVTSPILIKISDDKMRLKSAFFKNILSIAILTLPFAFIFALAPQLFVLILGEKWRAITTVLPILAVVGFVKSVSLASTALFISTKNQKYTTLITLVNILGLSISIVPLIINYGIFGAGMSALFGSLCAIPFIIYYTHKALFINT